MILSVDTGLNNFGVSVFGSAGEIHHVEVIKTKKTKDKKMSKADDMGNRIAYITSRLNHVFQTYPIHEIVGEMPVFGARSSNAAVAMTCGATIILTLSKLYEITPQWESPVKIKRKFIGTNTATKDEIMQKCCDLYDWPITYREVKTSNGIRKDAIYTVMGKKLAGRTFEHIADSIAAYHSIFKS